MCVSNKVVLSISVFVFACFFLGGCEPKQSSVTPQPPSVSCITKMKTICLEMRIVAGDNSGIYPFNISTNAGGTLELCQLDKDGFDLKASSHFRGLSNLWVKHGILVCPADKKTVSATGFNELEATNITYRLRTGKRIDPDSKELLIVCPVDGNLMYCDGYFFTTNGVVETNAYGQKAMGVEMHLLSKPR